MQPGDIVMTKARSMGSLPGFPVWNNVPWSPLAMPLSRAPVGQPALVLDWLYRQNTSDGAAKVRFPDGTEAWMCDQYLTRLGVDDSEVDVRDPKAVV